jgi:Leucine-rich repeat (LRR) protein
MGGLSKTIGTCAAIACLPGTWSSTGKQEVDNPCAVCDNTELAAFWGQMKCKSSSVEEEALRKIYSATEGKNWAFQSNWNSDKPICSWKGITCGAGSQNDNEGVTDIDLSDNNLVGVLPPEAYSFPSLKSLNVMGNRYLTVNFVGLDKAPFLELLYLSGTKIDNLNGISYAQSLIELHLTDCGMSGKSSSNSNSNAVVVYISV